MSAQQTSNPGGSSAPTAALQNRAGTSKSPFVNAAQHSMVHWQLLDSETVERAKQENKLIFLHIGYKACHCSYPVLTRCIVDSALT